MISKIKSRSLSFSERNWMMTYASLFTALLAFFILIITKADSEAKAVFKIPDHLKTRIYNQLIREKSDNNLTWLKVENTGTKGIKLLIPSIINQEPMFKSESDEVTLAFLRHFNIVAELIKNLHLESITQANASIIDALKKSDKLLIIELSIEGHTDKLPIRSGKFTNNWDLSIARAFTVMKFLKANTRLHDSYFSIAGYGPFYPRRTIENLSENRRVEIYIEIQLVDISNESTV